MNKSVKNGLAHCKGSLGAKHPALTFYLYSVHRQ